MTATPNRPEITAYLEMLNTFANATEVEGKLVLTGYGEDPQTGKKIKSLIKHFPIGDVGRMVDHVMTWTVEEHRNVYIPPVVMRPDLPAGKRGGKEDIVTVFGLVADYDDADAANWPTRVPIGPSWILETSTGRFQTVFLLNPSDAANAESLAHRLQLTAKCDHGTKDIDHVWRIPGTLNWPNRKKFKEGRSLDPVLVRTVPGGTGAIVAGLESVLVPLEESQKTKQKFEARAGVNVEALIARYKLQVVNQQRWKEDSELYELEVCPFNPDHTRAALIQFDNGATDFHCFHNSCAEHNWAALRGRLAEMAVDILKRLSSEDVKKAWLSFVDDLDVIGVQALIAEVSRLTGIGINTLKQAVTEHRAEATKAATAERIGDRAVIQLFAGDLSRAATEAEAAMVPRLTDGECVQVGECVMSVTVESLQHAHQADSDLPAHPTPHFKMKTRATLLPLVERSVLIRNEKGQLIDVSERLLDQILANAKAIPRVSALITHPVVTLPGRIISKGGIDKVSRLLMQGSVIDDLRPYKQKEARRAIRKIVRRFLEGFHFATPLDRAVALAMLFTAVERKVLDASPGFLADAAQQGSGKTSLIRRTHIIVTGTDLPVFTLPDTESELRKLLFAVLLSSPAMVCFDNVGDGLTFQSPALAAAMTSATMKDRILGVSRQASVSTATLFCMSGNNVQLGNDEASRIMPTRLITEDANPHKRTFKHPDILRHALSIREPILRQVVGIIAGYRQSTKDIKPSSRFPQWDALVRQPLIWAGAEDIGKAFDLNIEHSAELGAYQALVRQLKRIYPNGEDFSAGRLVKNLNEEAIGGNEEPNPVAQALWALRVKDISSERSIGHALSRMSDRRIEVDGHILCLRRRVERGLTRYWVEGGAIVEGFPVYKNPNEKGSFGSS